MLANQPNFWTEAEIARLDAFLLRDEAAENAMDTGMLDGFLCGLVSAPNMALPSQWLRWVWDSEHGGHEIEFASAAEASDIMGLIMRQWNAINDALTHDPQAYHPLLPEHRHDGGVSLGLDDWCMGYYAAMRIDMEAWSPLLVGNPEWLTTVLLYGTEDGLEHLEKFSAGLQPHLAAVDTLPEQVRAIHAHHLARRTGHMAGGPSPTTLQGSVPLRRSGPKLGRNEPCHCGSGKKYKHCHGAH